MKSWSINIQTFLPYHSFIESAKVLDNRRLCKQRSEVLIILNALAGKSKGWRTHPATLMWKGFEGALAEYGFDICGEWRRRGFKDTLMGPFYQIMSSFDEYSYPAWLGDDRFHSCHRAALLAKDSKWYGQFGWKEEAKIEYFWPSKEIHENAA